MLYVSDDNRQKDKMMVVLSSIVRFHLCCVSSVAGCSLTKWRAPIAAGMTREISLALVVD